MYMNNSTTQHMKSCFLSKRFYALLIVNSAVLICAYALFVENVHFACDTYGVYEHASSYAIGNFRHGRFFGSFLYFMLDNIGAPYANEEFSAISHIVYLVACAFFVSIVAELINTKLDKKFNSLVLLDVALLFCFINPCFAGGAIYFPEMILVSAVLTLMTAFAFFLWVKNRWYTLISALLLLTLAANAYALYIEFFFSVALMFVLVLEKFSCRKKTAISVAKVVVFTFLAGLLSILISSLGRALLGYTDPIYTTATISLKTVVKNFLGVLQMQPSILVLNGGLSYPFLFIVCCLVPLCFSIFIFFKIKNNNRPSLVVFFLGLFACWLIAFFPVMMGSELYLPQRAYVGLWLLPVYISTFFIYMLQLKLEEGQQSNNAVCNLGTFFALSLSMCLAWSFVNVLGIQANCLIINAIDQEQTETIGSKIDNYQKAFGVKVRFLKFATDEKVTSIFPSINFVGNNVNVINSRVSWSFPSMVHRYINSNITVSAMSEEEKSTLFGNQDWDGFNLDEQLIIKGDTAYLLFY